MNTKLYREYEALYGDLNNLKVFEGILSDELDSWFSAEYFFCDFCVDDFIKEWRGIYVSDARFQRNFITLDCLYSGSRFQQLYPEKTFLELIRKIPCPNCGRHLKDSIWPYEVPVDRIKYKRDIEEISLLSKRAPFVMLKHPFAKSIFRYIEKISTTTPHESFKDCLFRCRGLTKGGEAHSKSNSGVVPDHKATEGRFNHAGFGVLYLATTDYVAFKEKAGEKTKELSMARIELRKPLKLLDLTDLKLLKERSHKEEVFAVMVASSLLSDNPGGEEYDKPGYIFTRFVADCALENGFDGVKYRSAYSLEGFNIAIFRDKTDSSFNWSKIYEVVDTSIATMPPHPWQ